MEHIWDFIHTVDVNDIREVLERQKTYNMAIAREGMRGQYGSNIGALLLDMNGNDVRTRARAMAAAGSDARMNGCELPVIINSGSGNQGITASVPVIVYATELGVDEDTMYRAMALSDLTTIHRRRPSEDFPPTAAQSAQAQVLGLGSRISPARPTMRWSTP